MKFWQGSTADFPFYLYVSTLSLTLGLAKKLPNDTVTRWLMHNNVKFSFPVQLHSGVQCEV